MKYFAKYISILLAAATMLCITACGHNQNNTPSEDSQSNPAAQDVRLAPGEYGRQS